MKSRMNIANGEEAPEPTNMVVDSNEQLISEVPSQPYPANNSPPYIMISSPPPSSQEMTSMSTPTFTAIPGKTPTTLTFKVRLP